MILRASAIVALLGAVTPAAAQSTLVQSTELPTTEMPTTTQPTEELHATEEHTTTAPGAVLRGLDKVAGTHEDLVLKAGETVALGRLQITLGECRYPTENPSGDAFAWLVIRDGNAEQTTFEGWMIASSPALNALDHPRYDVWVLNCITE